MDSTCKFCGKPIWKDTDGWRHDSTGTLPICNNVPEPKEGTLCVNCGEPVHRATAAERARIENDWKHDDGMWFCPNASTKATGPKPAGKTLADFAGSRTPLFKRPMHGHPHGFTPGSEHLKEIRTSDWQGQHNTISDFPRLTAEDLTADDWQEVTE